MRTLFFAVTLALLLAGQAAAQSVWTESDAPAHFTLEVLKPSFSEFPGADISLLTSAVFAAGRFQASDRVWLVGEIPFAHFAMEEEGGDGSISETAAGNPYAGLEVLFSDRRLSGEVGVRIPVAPDGNLGLLPGIFSDVGRLEAFAPDRLSMGALLNYRGSSEAPFSFYLRGGPSLLLNTGGGASDLLMLYSAQGWYEAPSLILGGGLTGRLAVTGGGDLGGRTVHMLGVTAIGNFDAVQPGVLLKVPVDDVYSDAVSVIFGLTLTVPLQ